MPTSRHPLLQSGLRFDHRLGLGILLRSFRRFLPVAALSIVSALVLCLPSGASAADSEYQTILAKAKAGESVDWTALRMAWAKDPSYTPLPSRGDADHAAM